MENESKYPLIEFNEMGFAVVNKSNRDNEFLNYAKSWINFLLGEKHANEPTRIHKIIKDDKFYSKRLIQRNRHRDERNYL